MIIQTTRFGELDIADKDLIHLPDGILGFEKSKQFVLLEHDSEGTPFKWLQSTDEPHLAFIVMDPRHVVDNYDVRFDEDAAELTGCTKIDESWAMIAIVNIPRDNPIEMTVNIRAPIIIHLERRSGWQVILNNEDYPIRHRLFPEADGLPGEEPDADKAKGQQAEKK